MSSIVLIFIALGTGLIFLAIGAARGFAASSRIRDLEAMVQILRTKVADLELSASGTKTRETGEAEKAQPDPEPDIPNGAEDTGNQDGPSEPEQGYIPPAAPDVSVTEARQGRPNTLEQNITSKWFVWLGGVALALSGIFLVKYSIEYGLLGPATRVSLGLLMALSFGISGEWIRRRQSPVITAVGNQALVPASLSAAAVATAFGSVYAGYALYGLFSSTVAFILLVLIAAISILLAMLHGPFVAALGLVGAYLVPILVTTGSQSAWRLFLFLTIINAGGLVVVRHFAWRWLQNAIFAVALLWALLWVAFHSGGSDVTTLSAYLLILLLLIFAPELWLGAKPEKDGDPEPSRSWRRDYDGYARVAAAIGVLLLMVLIVVRADHDLGALIWFGVHAVVLMGIAAWSKDNELLTCLGAIGSVLILAGWKWQAITFFVDAAPGGPKTTVVDPVTIRSLWMTALAFGGLFGLAGYAGMWRARRPGIWAAVSAATPVLLFATVYWRAFDLNVDFGWAAVGLGLSGLALLCAWHAAQHRNKQGFEEVLGAYAVAVVAFLSLAAAMALRDAWLTVALSVMVPAISYIYTRLDVPALRYTVAIVALIVLVRLTLNLYIFDYGLSDWLGMNWILYGYGIPSLAFYWAARLFRRTEDGRLVMLLESGALLFFVLLLSFEIRYLVGDGRLDSVRYGFTEASLQSVAWGVTAFGLLRQYGIGKRPVPLWGYRVLGALATGQVVLLQCLVLNPVWRSTDVGDWPFINLLLIAYLIPSILFILASRQFGSQGERRLELTTGLIGLVLVFIYVTLEFRHFFRGSNLNAGFMSDAELYGYSLCWLVLAGVLLFLAVLKKLPALRYSSLAVTLLVIGKVFLVDMANLTGLYRAGSFLALGIVLLGIGYFYQRFVFAPAVSKDGA